MAAKDLAIFPAQLSVDRKLQADKSLQGKRKIKKASASQKLNLASAHCQQKNRSIWTIQPTIKTLKHLADTTMDERTTGGNSGFKKLAVQ